MPAQRTAALTRPAKPNVSRKRRRRRRPLRRAAAAAGIWILLLALYTAAMSAWIIETWHRSHAEPADCVIVLGAAVWDNRPSPALRERLDVVLGLAKRGMAPHIIVTGAAAPGELSEAAMSKRYLTEHGIPADRILVEDRSHSTMENLINAKAIMSERGYANAIIATHGFHALRARMMADELGLPASIEPVQVTPLNLVYYTLREVAGITVFQLERMIPWSWAADKAAAGD